MRYPCFPRSKGLQALAAKTAGVGFSPPVLPDYREALDAIDVDMESRLLPLRSLMWNGEVEQFVVAKLTRDQIEVELSLPMYQNLCNLPAQVLGDPDFWRFVALDVMWDFVIWRHGTSAGPANFGLDSGRRIPDCLPLRMFNRGLILSEMDFESPTFMRVAGVDFWQSHVLRVRNRYDARVVQLMLEAVRDGWIKDVDALRQVAKQIRQVRSNLVLESLNEEQLATTLSPILKLEA